MLINLTIPVYNEERALARSVHLLTRFLEQYCEDAYEITIAENGSTDGTLAVALELAADDPRVQVLHMPLSGRGQALERAWADSAADVLTYMDVDLSTDLAAFPALVEAVQFQGFDLAVGSRLLPESTVTRSCKREVISRVYNLLVRSLLRTRFSDAQCGFKAIAREAARELLPLVEDNGWFFDTELLFLAEKLGYQICDVPVHWVEGSDSRVRLFRTVLEDIRGLVRLRRRWGGLRIRNARRARVFQG
jgi:glycosyltransferase involved in cell wall biosynthesis